MQNGKHRAGLVVASNRLPFVLSRGDDGTYTTRPSSGGLVTALLPVLRGRGGSWIGWHGATQPVEDLEALLHDASVDWGYEGATVREGSTGGFGRDQ